MTSTSTLGSWGVYAISIFGQKPTTDNLTYFHLFDYKRWLAVVVFEVKYFNCILDDERNELVITLYILSFCLKKSCARRSNYSILIL